MPRASVNYALAATMLAQGANPEEIPQMVGAKNLNSLKVGLHRRGVTLTQARVLKAVSDGTCSLTMKVASQASRLLRQDMSDVLAKHTAALKEIKPRANLKHLKQIGEVIEPLARTAKLVHDWGSDSSATLDMSGIADEQQSIEIEATPQQVVDSPTPELPAIASGSEST